MPPSSSRENLRETLDHFVNGEAGVPFENLAAFAEPLFELYQVDLRAGLESAQNNNRVDELASLVAVLETARLLWFFLGLHSSNRRDRFPSLRRVLVGPNAGKAETQDFRELLANLKAHRNQLVDDDQEEAPPSTFDQLLERFADQDPKTPSKNNSYGPNDLTKDEARALFAQPLLETDEVLQDPPQMQEALTRAETYWDLAHASKDERQQRLASLKNRFANSKEEKRQVEREASKMLNRFERLFPNK